MSNDITNLRATIIPNSQQINADQLVGGTLDITVTDIKLSGSDQQPLSIHFEGDDGRPFKPAKTVRKILVFAWGEDGTQWIGRKMRLFHDPRVTWGGAEVGGIRVSHLSHIPKAISVTLAKTQKVKEVHRIEPLIDDAPKLDEVLKAIAAANNKATMSAAKAMAMKLHGDDATYAASVYSERVQQLKAPSAPAEPNE